MSEQPLRDRRAPGRCHCRALHGSRVVDDCPRATTGPDDPFCTDCTDRHEGRIDPGTVVTVRPPGEPWTVEATPTFDVVLDEDGGVVIGFRFGHGLTQGLEDLPG